MKSIVYATTITLIILLLPLLFSPRAEVAYAQATPQEELSVTNYSWKSYGVGRVATLGLLEITVVNSGKTNYKNIKFRIDLLTRTGKFLGSFQGTIPEAIRGFFFLRGRNCPPKAKKPSLTWTWDL